MNAQIVTLGGTKLGGLLSKISGSDDFADFRVVEGGKAELVDVTATVIDLLEEDRERLFEFIVWLRVGQKFRGNIIVVTFSPAPTFETGAHWTTLKISRSVLLQAPFLIGELFEMAAAGRPLDNPEMERMILKLGAEKVIRMAGRVRHEHDNKFGPALAHLRVIYKLSHYTKPDHSRIRSEFKRVVTHLTPIKISGLCDDVRSLLELKTVLGPHVAESIGAGIHEHLLTLESWAAQWESLEEENTGQADETVRHSAGLTAAIQSLLAFVTSLKTAAQRVVDYA